MVTLTGQVQTLYERWEAEDAAKRVFGVTCLTDDIEVTLADGKPDDSDLTERVLTALSWSAEGREVAGARRVAKRPQRRRLRQ